MRIAFLADIHANFEALNACLASLSERAVDQIVCLGDIVGYGADPVACLDVIRNTCGDRIVRGNHDEAVVGSSFRLNETAAAALRWTASVLSAEQKTYLSTLPLTLADDDRLYVHSSAASPEDYPYVHSLREASDSLAASKAHLTLCGHVHDPALYHISVTGKVMGFIPMATTPIPLLTQRRWLAVMGAVGQPRDGNPAAAYGIYDTSNREITFIRVPYDIEAAAAKIRAAGLPDSLWKRLSQGR
jgi:diadenosine tetraphosphatase ApaH/serine/threonine PP2A family protein phosphatase